LVLRLQAEAQHGGWILLSFTLFSVNLPINIP